MTLRLSMSEREQLVTFNRLKRGEITQKAAAKMLGFTTRWVRKKFKRFKSEGGGGLTHKNRGRSSPKKWPKEQINFMMNFFETSFQGFGPTFAAEKFEELYQIKISKESLRKLMIKNGYWRAKYKKTKHRKRRERKEYYGEMVQLDGSPHDWFEGRAPKCTLLVFIDDATSKIPLMEFAPSESTKSLMLAKRRYIESFGRPLSLYVDYGSVFSVNLNNPDREKTTQFARSCKQLCVDVIYARSAQAKGRVERSNKTHQDRLVKELRLAGISTISEANKFIREVYLPKHNQRYAEQPAKPDNAHRSVRNHNLDLIICLKEKRVIQNDFVVQYKKKILQILPAQTAVIHPKEFVTVRECFDGKIGLSIRGIELNFVEIKSRSCEKKPLPKKQHRYIKPPSNHPWRNYLKKEKMKSRVKLALPAKEAII